MSEIDWAALQQDAQDLVIPDGDYNVVVVDAEAVKSSTGKPMWKVKFRIVDGPKKDRPIWTNFTLSPENPFALRIFFTQMASFGLTADFFAQKPSPEQVAAALMNRMVTVTVSTRQFQGSDRNQVDQVKAYSGGGPVPPGVATGPATVGAPGGTPVGGPPVPSTPSTPTAAPSGPPVPTAPATPF